MQWQKICYTLYPKLKKLLLYGLAKNAKTSCRDHPSYYSMSNLVCVSGVKQPKHEADQSPPSTAKLTNQWHYTTTTPLAFNVCIGPFYRHFLWTFFLID